MAVLDKSDYLSEDEKDQDGVNVKSAFWSDLTPSNLSELNHGNVRKINVKLCFT